MNLIWKRPPGGGTTRLCARGRSRQRSGLMGMRPLMRGKREQRGRFVGIDLAWAVDTRHTGVAVAESDLHGLRLIKLSSNLCSLDDVVGYVASELAENTVIAIDASLIVENDLGQRPCETEIARTYG